MAIYDDVKITINLNELVEIRAKLLTQYENYATKLNNGEYLDKNDIDRIAVNLRETLTFDTIFQMVDESILKYLDLNEKNPSTTIETIELTMEKEKKEREKQFKKQFELVNLVNPSWTIEVPRVKR
jgi:biopolymer transport protein ExbB/TolQ